MANEQRLLTDINIVIEGNPLPIESGSGRLSNWPPYSREGSASTVGPNAYSETKRVPEIAASLQFTEGFDEARLEAINGVQVTGRQGGKRFIGRNCTLKDVEEIGGGTVGMSILVLGEVTWA